MRLYIHGPREQVVSAQKLAEDFYGDDDDDTKVQVVRRYRLYLPRSYNESNSTPVPLLLDYHGWPIDYLFHRDMIIQCLIVNIVLFITIIIPFHTILQITNH